MAELDPSSIVEIRFVVQRNLATNICQGCLFKPTNDRDCYLDFHKNPELDCVGRPEGDGVWKLV